MISRKEISRVFKDLQDSICTSLEEEDGAANFTEDRWTREQGGGGITRVITSRAHIEKGGVNFSEVFGDTPEKLRQSNEYNTPEFYATGLSIVLHPVNPYVPIIHMNIRYFELSDGTWWFGGGIDLTPHYIDFEDASFFHRKLQEVCNQHHEDFYPKFKKWADEYFYILHRKETRGIGGIFFDRLHTSGGKDALFNFTVDVGNSFMPIYQQIARKQKSKTYSELQRQWQLIRRGRYVEFNLVLDRGTKFGLETDGRIESILMSLPPLVSWTYNYQPAKNTQEYDTVQMLKKDIDWINIKPYDRLA